MYYVCTQEVAYFAKPAPNQHSPTRCSLPLCLSLSFLLSLSSPRLSTLSPSFSSLLLSLILSHPPPLSFSFLSPPLSYSVSISPLHFSSPRLSLPLNENPLFFQTMPKARRTLPYCETHINTFCYSRFHPHINHIADVPLNKAGGAVLCTRAPRFW